MLAHVLPAYEVAGPGGDSYAVMVLCAEMPGAACLLCMLLLCMMQVARGGRELPAYWRDLLNYNSPTLVGDKRMNPLAMRACTCWATTLGGSLVRKWTTLWAAGAPHSAEYTGCWSSRQLLRVWMGEWPSETLEYISVSAWALYRHIIVLCPRGHWLR